MEKKATVRDIAKAASVSVATVSYVLNDRKDTKISEATKKKVLQVANLLNYQTVSRTTAPSVGTVPSIGIVYRLEPDAPSQTAETMLLVHLLAERFYRMKLHTLLLPLDSDTPPAQDPTLDGIIAIDLKEAEFKRMANNYLVPILCLNMQINDFLFYQIYTDMETLMQWAGEVLGEDFTVVAEPPRNERYLNYLRSSVPKERLLLFPACGGEALRSLKGKKVAALGMSLGLLLRPYVKDKDLLILTPEEQPASFTGPLQFLLNDVEKKANLAMNIMMNAFEKKFDVKHEYKIC